MTAGEDDTYVAGAGAARAGGVGLGALVAKRYRIEALLGQGGMGAVYRAHDQKLDEPVALKLLTHLSESAYERFVREVRVARKVTHPNVARTHDLGEDGGVPFLTMELVSGEALDAIIEKRGPLPPAEVKRIGADIAAGLHAAHEAGVVHRDLKPANVLISDDGRAVLTDFGIARMVAGDGKHTGGLIGTPHYMAPEQVSGKPTDVRSDLYALGIILYEMATRELPFGGDTPISIAVARLTVPPQDPREVAAVPDDLAALILRCLAQDPARRPRSAEEVRAALLARPSMVGSTATPSSLYAPIDLGSRTLAVLPFAYRGASEHDYLGEGLAEELIDVLSHTRGLKLIALGATRRFADDRDPSRVGRELGADSIVDGTVQLAGERVRLSARLVDPAGVQVWSERFDGRFEDVFALQESMAKRVAEALRLELSAIEGGPAVPRRAVELYLKARRAMRSDIMSRAERSMRMLDEALELAPNFGPALAAQAITAIRAWWTENDDDHQKEERARSAVARAVAEAPDLAETHLARGMLAVQEGAFQDAARACAEALEIAPTMAEAHQYLGEMQIEAGRSREGRERLELTLELDPTLNICHLALGRYHALRGEWDELALRVAALEEAFPTPNLPVLVTRLRWALYADERALAESLYDQVEALGTRASRQTAALYGPALGRESAKGAIAAVEGLHGATGNPRFLTLMLQLVTEGLAAAGETEAAFGALARATELCLIDTEWFKRCPLLDPMRDDPRFEEARAVVKQRAAAIWR